MASTYPTLEELDALLGDIIDGYGCGALSREDYLSYLNRIKEEVEMYYPGTVIVDGHLRQEIKHDQTQT